MTILLLSSRRGVLTALFVICCTIPLCEAAPLRIGTINRGEPAREIKQFWPFTDYLAKQLKAEGIDRGSVVVASSIAQMAAYIREGKIDLLWLLSRRFPA